MLSAGYAMSAEAAARIDVPALSIGLLFALPFVREVRQRRRAGLLHSCCRLIARSYQSLIEP